MALVTTLPTEVIEFKTKIHRLITEFYQGNMINQPNYVVYIDENKNLKVINLDLYCIPDYIDQHHQTYFAQFKENAFVVAFCIDGQFTNLSNYPNAIYSLNPKEIAFINLGYYQETWIELQDYRKVDSYIVFRSNFFGYQPEGGNPPIEM